MECGLSGAGDFVKMVHNGIEYAIMQACAEGFDIFRNASKPELPRDQRYNLNLAKPGEVRRRGSVISSRLRVLADIAVAENTTLSEYSAYVQDSGAGRWTTAAAIEEAVPVDVFSAALLVRLRSREPHPLAETTLSAMRQEYGRHLEPRVEKKSA